MEVSRNYPKLYPEPDELEDERNRSRRTRPVNHPTKEIQELGRTLELESEAVFCCQQ